jgi:hypothetical protein
MYKKSGKTARACPSCGFEFLTFEDANPIPPVRARVPCESCGEQVIPRDVPLGMLNTLQRQLAGRAARLRKAKEERDAAKALKANGTSATPALQTPPFLQAPGVTPVLAAP